MKITERVVREVRLTEDDKNVLWAMGELLDEVADVFSADEEARELIDRMSDCLCDLETYLYMNTDEDD